MARKWFLNYWPFVRGIHWLLVDSLYKEPIMQTLHNFFLTHWGRVTRICVSNLTIIGSDNGLSPDRRQAITWTNAGILLIGPIGTNFREILIKIHTFSSKKIHLKTLSAKQRPFCLGLKVLTWTNLSAVNSQWFEIPQHMSLWLLFNLFTIYILITLCKIAVSPVC